MSPHPDEPTELKVALAGFGAIGGALARRLDAGIAGLRLAAISARDLENARRRADDLAHPVLVLPPADLPGHADVIVECAPAAAFRAIAQPALRAGRILMPVSVGALLEHADLIELAQANGARIVVPTGALLVSMPSAPPRKEKSTRSA